MKSTLLLCLLLSVAGCKDNTAIPSHHYKVTLYSSNGEPIRTWIAIGYTSHSDVTVYFTDEVTKQIVEVSGTLVFEVIP